MYRSARRRAGRARGARSGLSLIEVMTALVILAFGLLTLGLMQIYALRQGSAGRHTADAAAVGRTYLEQIQRLPFASLAAISGTGWTPPGWNGATPTMNMTVTAPQGQGAQVERTYTVQWRVNNVGASACLVDVEVQVIWNEDESPTPKLLTLSTRRYDWGGVNC